jgi:hypothetical protein
MWNPVTQRHKESLLVRHDNLRERSSHCINHEIEGTLHVQRTPLEQEKCVYFPFNPPGSSYKGRHVTGWAVIAIPNNCVMDKFGNVKAGLSS